MFGLFRKVDPNSLKARDEAREKELRQLEKEARKLAQEAASGDQYIRASEKRATRYIKIIETCTSASEARHRVAAALQAEDVNREQAIETVDGVSAIV
ncbi:MAG: hypothetical protein HYT21_02015 [Candidatus Nealsonbacteria bacterium]|nr:hypothetical protein [Candidatus Nealsonbacteria bacterium]